MKAPVEWLEPVAAQTPPLTKASSPPSPHFLSHSHMKEIKNSSQWFKESDLSKWEVTIFGDYLER